MKALKSIKIVSALIGIIGVSGCNKFLEEKPFTAFTVEYLKTPTGIQEGINSVYATVRFDYGPIGAVGVANAGTDEFTFADQVTSGADLELGTYQIPATNGSILTPWNRNYSGINLCNAIMQFAPSVPNMSDVQKNTIMGEASYLRAHLYFLLVSQFGSVPLDLGSGDLTFTDVPYYGFNRLPFNDILKKDYAAMINDLTFAAQNLPKTRPSNAFKLSQSAALHLLAKVYLYRAYSVVKENDDFQKAYDTAMELINNQGGYGAALQQNYAMVHKQGNDYNSEILYSVERLALGDVANEVSNPSTDFDGKANIAGNLFTPNYQNQIIVNQVSLIEDRPLIFGRPLRRWAPTKYVSEVAFAEKQNDSRWDATFRRLWPVATVRTGTELEAFRAKLAGINFALGDTAIILPNTEAEANALKARNKRYLIIGPDSWWNNQTKRTQMYPALKKYQDSIRNNFQDASGRPFIVSKLSETYLTAAEAAFKLGNLTQAADLINVLRQRAAYRGGLTDAQLTTRRAAMLITPSQLSMDFIMDERTRELCGEGVRWADLAIRNLLVDRVKRFNPDGAPNVQEFHNYRPIPRSQIDATVDPEGNTAKYQNPGYN